MSTYGSLESKFKIQVHYLSDPKTGGQLKPLPTSFLLKVTGKIFDIDIFSA